MDQGGLYRQTALLGHRHDFGERVLRVVRM
jgi:hypothetical protein